MAGRGAGAARDRGAWECPHSGERVGIRTSALRDIDALKAVLRSQDLDAASEGEDPRRRARSARGRSQDLFEVKILDGELERQGTLLAEVIGHGLGVALGVSCVFSASASNSQAPCI